MEQKTLILVIGCHRSGTSAVAGSLAAMGVSLGDDLIPPAFDNPRGFFESRKAVRLHDSLLAACGASWDRPPQDIILDPKLAQTARSEIILQIVRELPGPVVAVKDPRASLFVDLWRKACEIEGVRLCVLEVCRDRDATAASLMAREGWDRKRALGLVKQYEWAISKAQTLRRDLPWEMIRFPEEVRSEDAWRRIFSRFSLDIAADFWAPREAFDERLIHHGRRRGDPYIPPLWCAIIPSRSDDKVIECVASLIDMHPDIRPEQIVIVDDGLSRRTCWKLRGVTWVKGKRPFVFSKAINMGAVAAPAASDLVILGDDVRLATARALDHLAAASQGAAAVAPAVTGVCGQPAQCVGSGADTADWLAFVCVYIPRRAWDDVGPLDERFVGYGYDDVDWCQRARSHGELRVARDVRVLHLKDSSYRNREDWNLRYEENRVIFEEKWRPREVA
jgi:hypothetical protein